MRVLPASFAAAMAVVIAGLAVPAAQPGPAPVLKPASEFAAMADDKQRALALFTEAGKVIQHPRCVNCHPAGDRPMQGEDSHPISPWSCAAMTVWEQSACDVPRVMVRQTSTPVVFRGIRRGTSRQSKWRGSVNR